MQVSTRPRSLVDQLVGCVGLPRLAFALAVVGLLVLLLLATVFVQGRPPPGSAWRLWVVLCVCIEGDRLHLGADHRVRDLVGSLEVALEQQLAASGDQDSVDVGIAEGC
jgi:hypothetical protein